MFLLLLSFAPVLAGARDSRYTRHGTGPKYWIAYEYCYDLNKPMTELRWKNNIDWMAETFRDYGYDMICNDGWIEAAQTVDANGYITKYNSGWVHDFSYWNDYIESKGMKAGIYYNPLWLTRTAYGENCPVKGAGGITARQITGYHAFNGELYWVDVDKPGAEQWVKGYVRHFIDLGAKYLRIDFLENYEKNYGTERYEKALKWIAEEAGDEIFLSLVMPNCWNHGQTELKYGDMIRISDDCFEGDWDFVSGRRRGQHKDDWPQYGNVFDGCIAYRNSDDGWDLYAYASNGDIGAVEFLGLLVKGLRQGLPREQGLPDFIAQPLVPQGPEELLEIEGEHIDVALAADRNGNPWLLVIAGKAQIGTGCNDGELALLLEIAKGGPRPGAILNFVEDEDALAGKNP